MKVIPKMQQGGSYLSLFANYDYIPRPQTQQQGRQSSRASKGDNDSAERGKLTEKDLFSMLKDVDGLPNETQAVMREIQNMYQSVSFLGTDGISGVSEIADMYAEALMKITTLNFNKKEYDKAYTEVTKNQGLNEFAINGAGQLFAVDEDGKQQWISVSEYLNNKGKYRPFTNEELLQLRAQSPQFTYNNEMLSVINNGIGINKVAEMLRSNMRNLGTSEESISGYSAKVGKQVMQGLDVLEDLQSQAAIRGGKMTLDGLYKTKTITKDQYTQAKSAINYLISTLPSNAKAILQLHSENAKDPKKGAFDIVQSMVFSEMDTTYSVDNDFQENLNIDGSKKKTSDDATLQDQKLNVAEQFIRGLGNKETFSINPGTNLSTQVHSTAMQLVSTDGSGLGSNCSLQEVSEGQYNGILDWNNVVMGGKKIESYNFNKIIIRDGMVHKIDFPVDENGNPDLRPTTLEAKKKADKLIKDAGIDIDDPESVRSHYQEINQIMKDCKLSAIYDSNGKLASGNWKTFAVMNGYTDERALGLDIFDDNMLLNELTNEQDINSIVKILGKKTGLSSSQPYDYKKKGYLSSGTMFLEGTIWVPVNVSYVNAKAGSKSEMSAKLHTDLAEAEYKLGLQKSYNKAEQP